MKVIISGVIGLDVSPKEIRAALDAAGGQAVEVQISSPGGIIFAGLEIYNLIKNYRGPKISRLMGIAASMASYIALAGDRVVAEANAIFMIHNAQGLAVGDHCVMRKMAGILEGFSNLLAQGYSAKSGKTVAEVGALMDEETYLFGQEMLDAGFVDEIVPATSVDATNKAAAIASARASVASAQAKQAPWPVDAMEKAAALLGGLPASRRGPEKSPLEQAFAAGWTRADLVAAFREGISLDRALERTPNREARLSPRARASLLGTGRFTEADLNQIERDTAAEVAARKGA